LISGSCGSGCSGSQKKVDLALRNTGADLLVSPERPALECGHFQPEVLPEQRTPSTPESSGRMGRSVT
jgi:hypothetical protein